MKISFIIPAYNEERFLGDCLSAVFKACQKYGSETEVIVVNNASTDGTRKAAEAFPAVKIIDEQKKGIIFARRAGARAATGEILAHIDADTRMKEDWPERVRLEFANDPLLATVSGPLFYYDLSPAKNFWVGVFYSAGAFLLKIFKLFSPFKPSGLLQGGNFAVKKIVWDKLPQPDEKFNFYGEDTLLACELAALGRTKFLRSLIMPASGRRLKNEGVLLTGARYAINFIWTIIFGRPFTKKYSDLRS